MEKTLKRSKALFKSLFKQSGEGLNEKSSSESLAIDADWIDQYNDISKQIVKHFPLLPPICAVELLPITSLNANDYNPNKMARPESNLLLHSLEQDGLTLPLIVNRQENEQDYTIIDGYHRYELLKKHAHLQPIDGYVPAIVLSKTKGQAISSSVRHNIARGVHQVELTSEMILLLKNMGWTNAKIGKELGMDKDELLRMQQLTGLADLYRNEEFSKAWE
ncbi:ParB-like nuclease domain protein [Vibrio thalassae]|uniref:ParB-like nuclease domain protein n=1 Tax=Vibrio thalassae TaxID=1243014 RepID=A0A240EQ82_9VIBR|nr:ParB/RepB/Spo0J family partition protein [Vibrio thalassae]SNX50289.1 ParB-like nuclease domain protein [Vibrio thalassae]